MNEILILAAVFVAVLILVFALFNEVFHWRDVSRNIDSTRKRSRADSDEIDELLGSGNQRLRYYLDVVRNEPLNSTPMRMVQAGFFTRAAVFWFRFIRFAATLGVFVLIQLLLPRLSESISTTALLLTGFIAAGLTYMLCAIIIERMGERRMREYRKLFPDFMDLLLVCVDAGLSIEAALDRVTREFLQTVPGFGVQLSIVNLEIRAGRPLDEALSNLSERIRVEEARTLAVLFRQSKELGADVSRTLRSFAKEMRQMRIVKAEEKANALPIKMLFPMAFFMFPVSLIIVIVPILMTIIKLFMQMSPT